MRLPLGVAPFVLALLLSGCLQADTGDELGDTVTVPTAATDPPQALPAHGICEVTLTSASYEGEGYGEARCDADAATGVRARDHRAAVIEVAWRTLQPTVAGVIVRAGERGCGDGCAAGSQWNTLPGAYGSPIKLIVHGDEMATLNQGLDVVVLARGAAVEQAFTVHVSLFAEDDVDPGYTALG